MKKLVFAVTLFGLFWSCNDDGEEAPTIITIFTANVDDDVVIPSDGDAWLIVRDSESGDLIDFKEVTPGTIEFKTDKTINKGIDVTYFMTALVDEGDYTNKVYEAYIYTQMDVGSQWNVEMPADDAGQFNDIGGYELSVTGTPDAHSLGVSDKFGPQGSWTITGEVGGFIPIRPGASTQLITIGEPEQDPKYTFIDDITSGSEVELNYSSFSNFDRIVKFQMPEEQGVGAYVTGYDTQPLSFAGLFHIGNNSFSLYNSGFQLAGSDGEWAHEIPVSSVNLGYLDRFPIYLTIVNAGDYSYRKLGGAPTSIEYFDPSDITITSKDMKTFSFTTSLPVVRKVVHYGYSDIFGSAPVLDLVRFHFHGGPGVTKLNQPLPPELVTQYSVPIEELKYNFTEFFLKGSSHTDIANRKKAAGGYTYVEDAYEEIVLFRF